MKPKLLVLTRLVLVALIVVVFGIYKSNQSRFEAPRQNTPDINFTIRENFTLQAVISDLKYYNFIKDEDAFKYALGHSTDNTPGNENSLRIGINTIDREARYTINQSMTAWEIAAVLLNQGEHSDCDHGCPESNFQPELLPGGDLAPTIKERFAWIKTYEDCVEGVGTGHDGGQVFPDKGLCTSPDGRYFTEGQEGWSDVPLP